jgi:hypothetical protein
MSRDRSTFTGPPPEAVDIDPATIAPPPLAPGTYQRAVVYERPSWDPGQDGPQPLVQYSASVIDETAALHAGYALVTIDAGPRPAERVTPPAGEAYAFNAARWARRVEVTVSPTGRSARVWVDGVEIPAPTTSPE